MSRRTATPQHFAEKLTAKVSPSCMVLGIGFGGACKPYPEKEKKITSPGLADSKCNPSQGALSCKFVLSEHESLASSVKFSHQSMAQPPAVHSSPACKANRTSKLTQPCDTRVTLR